MLPLKIDVEFMSSLHFLHTLLFSLYIIKKEVIRYIICEPILDNGNQKGGVTIFDTSQLIIVNYGTIINNPKPKKSWLKRLLGIISSAIKSCH